MTPEERAKTIVIDPSKAGREELNDLIREGLRADGSIAKNDIKTETLSSKGLTKAETKNALSYDSGDVVQFNRDYKRHGVKKGEYLTVKKVNMQDRKIMLTNSKGKEITWNPEKWGSRSETFKAKSMVFSEGDKIRFNRKDKGRINGDYGVVNKINGNNVQVTIDGKKDVLLDLNEKKDRHWGLAYAETAHAAQGKTAERVMYHAESQRANLTNQKAFYVGISRAKSKINVYTDNKQALTHGLEQRTGDKQTALNGKSVQTQSKSEKTASSPQRSQHADRELC